MKSRKNRIYATLMVIILVAGCLGTALADTDTITFNATITDGIYESMVEEGLEFTSSSYGRAVLTVLLLLDLCEQNGFSASDINIAGDSYVADLDGDSLGVFLPGNGSYSGKTFMILWSYGTAVYCISDSSISSTAGMLSMAGYTYWKNSFSDLSEVFNSLGSL